MTTYISAEGLEKIKIELQDRKTALRKEIAERISEAKELGDLSENFEYQQAKDDQGSNEVRIAQLEQMIKEAEIVTQSKGGDEITLGVTFIAEINGNKKEFQIVGSSEADPILGMISNESPIGQAFIGRKVGETVEVDTPAGKVEYKILEIK